MTTIMGWVEPEAKHAAGPRQHDHHALAGFEQAASAS